MAQVMMPAIGAGTTHGKILQWRKREGDAVNVGDILADIETDKAVIELEAFDEGVLREILVPAGEQEIPVGDLIARIETVAADAPAQPALPSAPVADTPVLPVVAAPGADPVAQIRHVFASPSARRLARLHDIDLCDLEGSGPGGRIVRVDIERATAAVPSLVRPVASVAVPPVQGVVQRTPHSSIRKTTARRLQESKRQIPHFYLTMDVRMDPLLALRAKLNAGLAMRGSDLKLSVNDLIVYVAGHALRQSPEVNVRWTEDAIEYLSGIDVSVAVATERGLFTPVLRDVADRRLAEVAEDLHGLLARAHAGRLLPEQYQGGGLTVSNLGMFGVSEFSAIINPPQAAILAVGAIEKRPVAKGKAVKIKSMMTATLSADHRALDGAAAARFLARLRDLIQSPAMLLV